MYLHLLTVVVDEIETMVIVIKAALVVAEVDIIELTVVEVLRVEVHGTFD